MFKCSEQNLRDQALRPKTLKCENFPFFSLFFSLFCTFSLIFPFFHLFLRFHFFHFIFSFSPLFPFFHFSTLFFVFFHFFHFFSLFFPFSLQFHFFSFFLRKSERLWAFASALARPPSHSLSFAWARTRLTSFVNVIDERSLAESFKFTTAMNNP